MMGKVMKEFTVEAMPYLDKNRVLVRWLNHDGELIADGVYVREGYPQRPMFEWDDKNKDWVMLQYDIAHDMGGRWR